VVGAKTGIVATTYFIPTEVVGLTLIDVRAVNNQGDGFQATALLGSLTISDSSFVDNGSNGLSLTGAADVQLKGVTASKNGQHGLILIDGGDARLTGVTANNNTHNGLTLVNVGDVQLKDVTASSNGHPDGLGATVGSGVSVQQAVSFVDTDGTYSRNADG